MSVSFELPMTPGLVSDYLLEVAEFADEDTDPGAVTDWTTVRGIQEITPPAIEKNLEDDSDIDSGAWGSQVGTGIEYTLEGTCKRPAARCDRSRPGDPHRRGSWCRQCGSCVVEAHLQDHR